MSGYLYLKIKNLLLLKHLKNLSDEADKTDKNK